MFVVRPANIMTTPRLLAQDLGWQTRYFPNGRIRRPFDFQRDFFMANINTNFVVNAPGGFEDVYRFFRLNKYGQRQTLSDASIPVPRVAAHSEASTELQGTRFVVRPLRHSGGRDYRVTDDRTDFTPGTEYISEFYPKRREYRVIFVFGKPLIWLRKKPNEGIENDAPWGHVNSFFQTINDVPACRLSRTDCVDRLSGLTVVANSHIVAADILYNDRHDMPFCVLELNACPALTLDNNRAKVVEAIRARGN